MNDYNFHYIYKKLPHNIICQLPCRKPSPVKEFALNSNPLTSSKIEVFLPGRKF